MAAEKTRERNQIHELDGQVKVIGKLICYKSDGKKFSKSPTTSCQIFRGKFENETKVFIRRFDIDRLPRVEKTDEECEWKEKEFKRDMELLRVPERTSHMHENFTRYFCCEKADNFFYVAIEWCICSVEDLYVGDRKGYDWDGNEIDTKLIKESLKKKEILRQATKGVAFLHAMGFVHRNLKPSNFLIARIHLGTTRGSKYLVKVSDFRMSKELVTQPGHSGQRGSEGWISPYPPKNDAKDNTHASNENDAGNIKTHPSEDVFILGCLFHYVLTNGKHPFGINGNDRVKNINDKDFKVYKPVWTPEIKVEKEEATSLQDEIDYRADTEDVQQAVSLLKDMIKFKPEERPALKTILGRAYFLPDDYYKLYDLPKIKPGLCVIFNQEIFDNKADNRKGTEQDKNALTDVFENFGFKVDPRCNLKAQQLCDEIIELSKEDFSEYACLVVCIFSHGNEGTVCGTEGNQVSIEDAKKQFNDNNCPSLSGKPKIWIIQACQGGLEQDYFKYSTPSLEPKKIRTDSTIQENLPNADSVSHGIQPIQFQQVVYSKPPDIPRPPVSDMLDIRATVPGFVSYRNTQTGSTLIRNLCKQLRTTFLDEDGEKSNRHLEDLLKMVQKSIIKERASRPSKQTIEWRSTLINFIRFERK